MDSIYIANVTHIETKERFTVSSDGGYKGVQQKVYKELRKRGWKAEDCGLTFGIEPKRR